MTPTTKETKTYPILGKLIHIGSIFADGGKWLRLFLRKTSTEHFTWNEVLDGEETETTISAQTIEEAIRLAHRQWKLQDFRTLNCGFKYYLPERDEHGINALFYQMAASYGSMNGVYYDEELGNNCFVQNASEEGISLWRQLRSENRLGGNG